MRTEKKCSRCNTIKPLNEFSINNRGVCGRTSHCVKCNTEQRRTKRGVIGIIYNNQLAKSRERNHPPPAYTVKELRDWVLSKEIYHSLYSKWVESNYEKLKKPSIDRLDDYKPYTFGNIRIVTWEENQIKEYEDRKNGLNNKLNRSVSQFSKDGIFIQEFHSISYASRVTGIYPKGISACANGKSKSAGGFAWR